MLFGQLVALNISAQKADAHPALYAAILRRICWIA
jgi:hypothetical protein